MGKFEDRLLDTLLREHGERLSAEGGRPATTRGGRHRGRWVVAIGTVAAVVAGVVVVQTVPFGDRPAASSAAADVLTSAADRIRNSDPVVGPGQYLYVESHRWDLATEGSLTFLVESVNQTWVPYDRSQEWLQRTFYTGRRTPIRGSEAELAALPPDDTTVEELRARCGQFYPEGGIPEGGGMVPCEFAGNWGNPTPEFVAALPADPKELYDELRRGLADQGSNPDGALLDFVQDSVGEGLLSAELRARLYRALALLPSLRISDRDANVDGRVGVGLGIDANGRRQELIIDPATGQLIGERETQLRGVDQIEAGTVTSYTALTTRVAAEAGR